MSVTKKAEADEMLLTQARTIKELQDKLASMEQPKYDYAKVIAYAKKHNLPTDFEL